MLSPETLVIIPARAGSKGIPGKNWRNLGGKALIQYSMEQALEVAHPDQICISTDSPEVQNIAQNLGLTIPFTRPEALSGDSAGSREVLLHALDHYEQQGQCFENILLLQATSPFRRSTDLLGIMGQLSENPRIDAVFSVVESRSNPYYTHFRLEQDCLQPLFDGQYTRRQDLPQVWELNGSLYAIRVSSLRAHSLGELPQRMAYKMPANSLVDLDTELDWLWAEFLLQQGKAYL
jgi:CMP-N,N'-diacetyllegionaminic acid synthase